MTAVEWFFNQIEQHKLTFGDIHANVLNRFRKQSKRMEKEQNIEFAKHCLNKALDTDIRTAYKDVEKYYTKYMAQQTAVESLYDNLFPKQLDGFSEEEWKKIDTEFEKAKQIEKEQKIKFAADFFRWWWNQKGNNTDEGVKQYYNEIYGTADGSSIS